MGFPWFAPLLLLMLGGFTLIALVQCFSTKRMAVVDRLVWSLMIVFVPVLGPVFWWAFSRRAVR